MKRNTHRRRMDKLFGGPTEADLRRQQADHAHNQPAAIKRDLAAARVQLAVAHRNGWQIVGGYQKALDFLAAIEARLPTLADRPLSKSERDRLHSMAQDAVETH